MTITVWRASLLSHGARSSPQSMGAHWLRHAAEGNRLPFDQQRNGRTKARCPAIGRLSPRTACLVAPADLSIVVPCCATSGVKANTAGAEISKLPDIAVFPSARTFHFYLRREDVRYFLREYTARKGYAFSATRELVVNFEKSLKREKRA